MELQKKLEDLIYNPWTAVPMVLSAVVGAVIGIAAGFYVTFQAIVWIGAR